MVRSGDRTFVQAGRQADRAANHSGFGILIKKVAFLCSCDMSLSVLLLP